MYTCLKNSREKLRGHLLFKTSESFIYDPSDSDKAIPLNYSKRISLGHELLHKIPYIHLPRLIMQKWTRSTCRIVRAMDGSDLGSMLLNSFFYGLNVYCYSYFRSTTPILERDWAVQWFSSCLVIISTCILFVSCKLVIAHVEVDDRVVSRLWAWIN